MFSTRAPGEFRRKPLPLQTTNVPQWPFAGRGTVPACPGIATENTSMPLEGGVPRVESQIDPHARPLTDRAERERTSLSTQAHSTRSEQTPVDESPRPEPAAVTYGITPAPRRTRANPPTPITSGTVASPHGEPSRDDPPTLRLGVGRADVRVGPCDVGNSMTQQTIQRASNEARILAKGIIQVKT